MPSIVIALPILVLPVMTVYAAVSDLFTMRIPNRISLVLVAAFALAVPVAGLDGWTAALHLFVGLGVLCLTFGMFAAGWIGGGDAKLAAALALWMGPGQGLPFGVYTALFGGGLTLAFLSFRAIPLPQMALREEWILRLHGRENGVPYGIAIAAGAMAAFPATPWFKALAPLL
ncbi:A24 family peptidase [Chthonobacter rhizosphaerae]|uniref:A24 family peptidase n=1 Tax=Chthonobacter rhizosphaerae TaxID=2735553 RepID=UPI0015EE442D|nr:prepilin peptidase [Chthonobacter rhizosphaerae]